MYKIAEDIGLPASFVDLRHDATHGPLPSLVVLREAARKALAWLWVNHWSQLVDEEATVREQLRDTLNSYCTAYRLTIGQVNDSQSRTAAVAKASDEIDQIISGRLQYVDTLAALISEGWLKKISLESCVLTLLSYFLSVVFRLYPSIPIGMKHLRDLHCLAQGDTSVLSPCSGPCCPNSASPTRPSTRV